MGTSHIRPVDGPKVIYANFLWTFYTNLGQKCHKM